MPTSHPTISEPSARLTDPALALAAELARADAALDATEEPAAADITKRCNLESDLLRTKPTTAAGAVALLDAARKVHRGQHGWTGQWPDGYEAATNAAMSNVAELLRTATWGQLQPTPAEDEFMARARASDRRIDLDNRGIDEQDGADLQKIEDALINAPAPGLRALAWKAQQLAGFTMNAGEEWGVMAAQAIMRDVARLAPEARSPIYGDMYERATGEAPSASIAPASSGTDTALLLIEQRFNKLRDEMDDLDPKDDRYDNAFMDRASRLGELEDLARLTPAASYIGFAAKLRIVYRNGLSGAVKDEHPCADMIRTVIGEMDRLGGPRPTVALLSEPDAAPAPFLQAAE